MQNSIVKKITVNASSKYDVLIGGGLLDRLGELMSTVLSPCKVAVITDDTVDNLYSKKVIESLESKNFSVVKFTFVHGEERKNLNTYCEILNFLAKNELTRTDAIVALGGGVVGDMAGFASATYLRGVKYIQVPTTLLAQVDSSVGGKTAVDLDAGKNLVGAFKQPSLVVCDTDTLNTLSKDTYLDGMGEVCKYAILTQKVYNVLSADHVDINELVYQCLNYKKMVVEEDEFEMGIRKYLNLGHTPAHAIEKLSDYKISHGLAVGMGLKIILDGAKKSKIMSAESYDKILSLIGKQGVLKDCPFTLAQIYSKISQDKKRSGDDITLVMPSNVEDIKLIKVKLDHVKEYF